MNFVGQQQLIQELKETKSRTLLIYGPKHHGKKTLIRMFYAEKGLPVYEITGNIADFRESIELIRTQMNPTVYLIPDVDTLNPAVQNLLLKVLEEPPLKATFVLTASNRILATIKSRCVTFVTAPYTQEELLAVSAKNEKCLEYADSPGRCELIRQAVDFEHPEPPKSLRNHMEAIKQVNDKDDSIGRAMVHANEICKILKEKNIPYFTLWLLARVIYPDSDCLSVLSAQIDSLDRYIVLRFFMEYIMERNSNL